eukprot:CAMPEP_0117431104 /NCGR_PEP_ID=MMETSP0758-20121206/10655_1 /TAXON_ID=63605 /ORGANISM="Percolomonas cosmopolitus, Strain AE-1 (ATCC 50343)" /LENGTH=386 /DNA_ID=CAMNT_0005219813 /DNA_START=279 /DNA_END=1435 /DNA_ORIENTATION=+
MTITNSFSVLMFDPKDPDHAVPLSLVVIGTIIGGTLLVAGTVSGLIAQTGSLVSSSSSSLGSGEKPNPFKFAMVLPNSLNVFLKNKDVVLSVVRDKNGPPMELDYNNMTNPQISVENKFYHKNEFISQIRLLRARKFAAYAHCRYCYEENMKLREKNKDLKNPACFRCGLPLPDYVHFTEKDRFCLVCAMLNKYQTTKHGRCKLHLGDMAKSKRVHDRLGSGYCVYRSWFSMSNSNKRPKNITWKIERLDDITQPHIWKLNNIIRFEYLYTIKDAIVDFGYLRVEAIQQVLENANAMIEKIPLTDVWDHSDHGLIINLNELTLEEKMEFKDKLMNTMVMVREAFDHQLKWLNTHGDYSQKKLLELKEQQNHSLEKEKEMEESLQAG